MLKILPDTRQKEIIVSNIKGATVRIPYSANGDDIILKGISVNAFGRTAQFDEKGKALGWSQRGDLLPISVIEQADITNKAISVLSSFANYQKIFIAGDRHLSEDEKVAEIALKVMQAKILKI